MCLNWNNTVWDRMSCHVTLETDRQTVIQQSWKIQDCVFQPCCLQVRRFPVVRFPSSPHAENDVIDDDCVNELQSCRTRQLRYRSRRDRSTERCWWCGCQSSSPNDPVPPPSPATRSTSTDDASRSCRVPPVCCLPSSWSASLVVTVNQGLWFSSKESKN